MKHKKFWWLLIISVFLVLSTLSAQDEPDSDKILEMIGLRLNKVFQNFGYPKDLLGSCEDNQFEVTLDYGTYAFKIKSKTVIICFFWEDYKKPVRGIKIGDSSTKVISILGKPFSQFSRDDGSTIMFWDDKENDAFFVVFLSEDGTVKRIQLELK